MLNNGKQVKVQLKHSQDSWLKTCVTELVNGPCLTRELPRADSAIQFLRRPMKSLAYDGWPGAGDIRQVGQTVPGETGGNLNAIGLAGDVGTHHELIVLLIQSPGCPGPCNGCS